MLLLSCYLAVAVSGSRTVISSSWMVLFISWLVGTCFFLPWLLDTFISAVFQAISRVLIVMSLGVVVVAAFSLSRLVDTCFLSSRAYQLVISATRLVLFISMVVGFFFSRLVDMSSFQAISGRLLFSSRLVGTCLFISRLVGTSSFQAISGWLLVISLAVGTCFFISLEAASPVCPAFSFLFSFCYLIFPAQCLFFSL